MVWGAEELRKYVILALAMAGLKRSVDRLGGFLLAKYNLKQCRESGQGDNRVEQIIAGGDYRYVDTTRKGKGKEMQ